MANTKVPVELFDAGAGFTIGSGAAEDTKIVFDGNAQDYYIGLDDSADDLLIGLGSTVGTTPAISIDENLKATLSGDVEIGTTAPKINLKNTDTSIVADQSLGVIEIESTDGSTGSAGTIAKLDIAASGTFDGSGHGSEFRFSVGATNQSGSIALSEAMRINSAGNLYIGATSPEAEAKLHISSTSDLHQIVLSSGSHTAIGNSGSADYAEGVVAVQTVSSGNQLTIPVTSQSSLYRPMYVELMFVDGSYNSQVGNGGFAKCDFSALNALYNFASHQTGGNVSSVTVSGMNLIVNFTTAYTGGIGSSDGLYMRYKVISLSPELFKAYDATLN